MPEMMKAIALDRFGGIDELSPRSLPVPGIDADEILIQVHTAGLAEWDPYEREGKFVEWMGAEPRFPYVLGSDGAGVVAAVGEGVEGFIEGDRVYAASLANEKGGFYAEYIAISANKASHIPVDLSTDEAGVMAVDAITALTGVSNVLQLQRNETVMVFGASGGVGHLAVQFANRIGARVFAVASGEDGVKLLSDLGADYVIDGRREDIVEAAMKFAPRGLDAALVTAGGEVADRALTAVREGGRVAFPDGVVPRPNGSSRATIERYNMMRIGQESMNRLNQAIVGGSFKVHLGRMYPLQEVVEAHRALGRHYLGKLALKIRG